MTREDNGGILIVILFSIAAIGVCNWADHQENSDASIVVLKTRAVDMGEEIAKRRDAFYDRRMDE